MANGPKYCFILLTGSSIPMGRSKIHFPSAIAWRSFCLPPMIWFQDVNQSGANYYVKFPQDLRWFGLRLLELDETPFHMLHFHLFVLSLMTFHQIIRIRQKYDFYSFAIFSESSLTWFWFRISRIDAELPQSTPLVFYPNVTRAHADVNIRYCLMFLANYGFYKFGVEVSKIS